MNLTLIRHSNEGLKRVQLNVKHYTLSIVALVMVLGLSAYMGIQFGQNYSDISEVEKEALQSWRQQLETQKQAVSVAKKQSQQQLDALAARVGILQAHIRRLDAASVRIAGVAGLDVSEFNFESSPAVGGPEDDSVELQSIEPPHFLSMLDELKSQLSSRDQQLSALEKLLLDKDIDVSSYISGRPIKKGWMSSKFGRRNDPFTGRPAWHAGVDFAGKEGADIISTAAGVVTYAGDRYGYGLLVEVNHGDGYVTRYGHNKQILVKTGEMVQKGQTIAKMGNTGRSTGVHVHYEILKDGKAINPAKYVNRRSKS